MPGFGRAISDTCDGEKENARGGGGGEVVSCQTLLKQNAPFYECYEK